MATGTMHVFYDETPAAIATALATGAERFENAARNHLMAKCVQLARMGCVYTTGT